MRYLTIMDLSRDPFLGLVLLLAGPATSVLGIVVAVAAIHESRGATHTAMAMIILVITQYWAFRLCRRGATVFARRERL